MSVLKVRKKSDLLKGLEILNSRIEMTTDIKKSYTALKSGLDGEEIYDRLIEETNIGGDGRIVLNDLLLSINGSTIQIDSLVLTAEMIYLFEIKNYRGSYIHDSDQFRKVDGFGIPNPKNQLNKAITLMGQLFKQWKVATPLAGAVVFVNQSFTLYGSLPDEQMVLPSQLTSYFSALNNQKNKIPHHIRMLANRLIEQHKDEAPYQKQLPVYSWDKLKKGLTCGSCKSFNLKLTQRSCFCKECLRRATRKENFLSNIEDLKLLYPQEKLTTRLVYEWLGGKVSKDTIKNSLLETYSRNGNTKAAYYE